MSKIREKYWGDEFIRMIVFLVLTVLCFTIIFASEKMRGSLEREVAAKYHCDAVDFSYNEDETASAPLGYTVVCKNYTSDGHLTKTYEWDEQSNEWYEESIEHDLVAGVFGFCGFITFILTLLFGWCTIHDVRFIRKFHSTRKDIATN